MSSHRMVDKPPQTQYTLTLFVIITKQSLIISLVPFMCSALCSLFSSLFSSLLSFLLISLKLSFRLSQALSIYVKLSKVSRTPFEWMLLSTKSQMDGCTNICSKSLLLGVLSEPNMYFFLFLLFLWIFYKYIIKCESIQQTKYGAYDELKLCTINTCPCSPGHSPCWPGDMWSD